MRRRLGYAGTMDVAVQHADHARPSEELIDVGAIAAELDQLAASRSGGDGELRTAVAQRLKSALAQGRAKAEKLLLNDRDGRRCAERLCRMEDEIIRLLFDFARAHLYPSTNPSEAERMAVVATGGYGRGLQAPDSDIDLLFVLPYKQTAWGESIAEAILYCLWDLGLKVGQLRAYLALCIDANAIGDVSRERVGIEEGVSLVPDVVIGQGLVD